MQLVWHSFYTAMYEGGRSRTASNVNDGEKSIVPVVAILAIFYMDVSFAGALVCCALCHQAITP